MPVAALGETVAVSVTLAPAVGAVVDAVSVVVVAVVLVPPGIRSQKCPQPETASIGVVSTARRTRRLLLPQG